MSAAYSLVPSGALIYTIGLPVLREGVLDQKLLLTLSGIALCGLGAGTAHALDLVFTKVADTGTAAPGGSETFTLFLSDDAAIDGDLVAFIARTTNDGRGIYSFRDGVLTRVADKTTSIPGGSGTFTDFDDPAVSGNVVVFAGLGTGQEGIYGYNADGTSPFVIADFNTEIPGGEAGDKFDDFHELGFSAGTAVFYGEYNPDNREGIYRYQTGVLSVLADTDTTAPDSNPAANFKEPFAEPAIFEGVATFKALDGNGRAGLFADFGSGLVTVADDTMSAPGAVTNFLSFDESDSSGENVVFQGGSAAGAGVYISRSGVLDVIADTNTAIPGGTGNFIFAGNPSISGRYVLFDGDGSDDDQDGIYVFDGNSIEKILTSGDMLDGKIVEFVFLNPAESISGNRVILSVDFEGGSEGLFIAEIIDCDFYVIPAGGASTTVCL